MSQVLITFTGIEAAFGGSIQVGLGVFPNQSVIHFLPQINSIPSTGALYAQCYGSITLANCLVDKVGVSMNDGGKTLYAVILDRRWKWKWRLISGRYNVRRADGSIEPSTLKTPRELATLLFQALGEPLADVSKLPNDGYPQVAWTYARAQLELAQLCHSRGCDVALNVLNDTFGVERLGFGNPAVATTDTESIAYSVDPPQPPDAIVGLFDETLYQSMFRLEAVGRDVDGTWKPIDDLSYAPVGGWIGEPDIDGDAFMDDDPIGKALAQATVYKCWRIVSFADGTLNVQGRAIPLTQISQVLPLNRILIETYQDDMGVLRPKPYQLGGFFMPLGDPPPEEKVEEFTQYDGESSLNVASGIVTTDRRLFIRQTSDDRPIPAELYLTTSFGIKDPTTGEAEFGTYSYGPGGQNQMPFQLPELAIRHRVEWDTSGSGFPSQTSFVDNRASVSQQAANILQGISAQFSVSSGSVIVHRGIVPGSTDGIVRQVQWLANLRKGATTIAYNNYELSPAMPRQVDRENFAQSRLAWEHYRRQQAEYWMLRDNGLLRDE